MHGKKILAKERGAWHGLGGPPGEPTYYGPGAHDGRTRYLALDGTPLGGLSTSGAVRCSSTRVEETRHDRSGKDATLIKARVAALVALAAATGRVLLLPRVLHE